jgi:hypothetical protein
MEVQDAREIVFIGDSPRAAGAGLPGRGVCTQAVHPGSARRGAPATPRLASAPGHPRSARHRRGCGGGPTGACGDQGDAVDAGGVEGVREGQRRQDGGQAARQHRLAGPRGAEQ